VRALDLIDPLARNINAGLDGRIGEKNEPKAKYVRETISHGQGLQASIHP
jgi:hypothetical protein